MQHAMNKHNKLGEMPGIYLILNITTFKTEFCLFNLSSPASKIINANNCYLEALNLRMKKTNVGIFRCTF